MAKFRGKEIGFIRGRGVAVFGDVAEGVIKVGMKLVLPDAQFEIIGIELAKCVDEHSELYTQAGLALKSDKQAKEKFWDTLTVRDVIFEVRE